MQGDDEEGTIQSEDDSDEGEEIEDSDSQSDEDEEMFPDAENNDVTGASISTKKWCSCGPCIMLQKYDNPLYSSFFEDLTHLFQNCNSNSESEGSKKFLKLREISPNEKKVELVPGRGILKSLCDKEQLKVDFKNKPSSLARETLFGLYGREAFQTLTVTGCGNKRGSYTIPPNVLKAVLSFVNRNVNADKALKKSTLTAIINKRASEWRKSSSVSPKEKQKRAKSSPANKVTSTSPFKASPRMLSPPRKLSPLMATPSKIKESSTSSTNTKGSSPLKATSPSKTKGTSSKGASSAKASPIKGASSRGASSAKASPIKTPTKTVGNCMMPESGPTGGAPNPPSQK